MQMQNALAHKIDIEQATPVALAAEADMVSVETRFGVYAFDPANTIAVAQGLPGFPQAREFGLATLPGEKLEQFMLFQSLEGTDPGFVVLPAHIDNAFLDLPDVEEALKVLGIANEDATILLVVSARKEGEAVALSLNLRAPIIVDTRNRTARQYVLPNGKYDIRHTL